MAYSLFYLTSFQVIVDFEGEVCLKEFVWLAILVKRGLMTESWVRAENV